MGLPSSVLGLLSNTGLACANAMASSSGPRTEDRGLDTNTGFALAFRVVSFLRYLFSVLEVLLTASAAQDDLVADTPQGEPIRSNGHEQGDDHLLERPRNTGRDTRGRSSRRDFHRARAFARSGWQRLQGTGLEGAAGDAVSLCGSWART